jgi:hypothetical protein
MPKPDSITSVARRLEEAAAEYNRTGEHEHLRQALAHVLTGNPEDGLVMSMFASAAVFAAVKATAVKQSNAIAERN